MDPASDPSFAELFTLVWCPQRHARGRSQACADCV